MPNIQSAKKRLKQSLIQRERNRSAKRSINTERHKVLAAPAAGNVALAESEFKVAAKKLDRAAGARCCIAMRPRGRNRVCRPASRR